MKTRSYTVCFSAALGIAAALWTGALSWGQAVAGFCSHPFFDEDPGIPRYGVGDVPAGVAVGDLDGDLDLDVAVANNASDDVSVLLNNGDGTFAAEQRYGAGDAPYGPALGDLDGDLDLDLATANWNGDNVSVLLNNGNGTFAGGVFYGVGDQPGSIVMGALDGDNDLDLALTHYGSDNVWVLLNNGNGTFAAGVAYASGGNNPARLAAGDLDGDLDLDLVVPHAGSPGFVLSVMLNNGNGNLGAPVLYGAGVQHLTAAVGDLDGDSDLDVAVTSVVFPTGSRYVRIYLNNGNGILAPPTDYNWDFFGSTTVAMTDLDLDLDLDLVLATSDKVSVLLNNGNGTFQPEVIYVVGALSNRGATGDLNADGNPDVAVSEGQLDHVAVLLNLCDAQDCPADLDGSGDVGITDFLDLLAQWGTDPGGPPDLDGDGNVGITDFLALLATWGPCS